MASQDFHLSTFPQDLITDILTRLPVKSLTRFESVSKSWSNLFKTQHFISQHRFSSAHRNPSLLLELSHWRIAKGRFVDLDQYVLTTKTTDLEFHGPSKYFTIMGVCYGLVCCVSIWDKSLLFLWNPATRKIRKLPEPINGRVGENRFGFCFNSNDHDFKVVSVSNLEGRSCSFGQRVYRTRLPIVRVEMYSLSSGVWNEVGEYNCEGFDDENDQSVVLNGVMFWMESPEDYDNHKWVISFDTSSQVFRRIPIPSSVNDCAVCKKLAPYKDSVAMLVCKQNDSATRYVDLWVLDKELKECWNMVYTVGPFSKIEHPVGIWKEEILIAKEEIIYGLGGFKIELPYLDHEITYYTYDWYNYEESLVCIYGGNAVEEERVQNIERDGESSRYKTLTMIQIEH